MNGQKSILISVLIILGSAAALLLVRSQLFRLLHRMTRRTETQIDDLLVAGLRFPSLFIVILGPAIILIVLNIGKAQ